MTKRNTTQSALTRALSFLLALCAIAMLLPQISANAADVPNALRVGAIYAEEDYSSPNLGGTVTIRDIPVVFVDGATSVGFCFNHGAKLTAHTSGYRWVSDGTPIAPSSIAAAPFLAFFYSGLATENWNDWERNLVSSWVQVALWLSQTGAFTDYRDSSQILMVAQERAAVLATLGMSATVDDAVELMQRIISSYEAGVYGTLTAYVYYYDDAAANMQPVFIGFVEHSGITDYSAYIKLAKTVENRTGNHGDAVFGIYSDSTCADEVSKIRTTASQWNTSDVINLTTPTATLYVREISSGDPSLAVNSGVFAVNVDSAIHNTAATAAAVVGDGADGSIVNRAPLPPPTGGILHKVDAATGGGLPGGTFRFYGNATGGGLVDLNATTDATGIIELQWLDASAPNYIPPGEFTVSEEIAPAGYEKTDESRHLRLWVETVDGNPVARSSGVLIFENYKKHALTLRKTSDGSLNVAGAVFDIYRNGTKIDSRPTNASGTITLPIVESGYFEFVEVTPPSGMVLPHIPRVGVYIDATDTSITDHYVSMKNYEYPEIVITKQSKTTNLPLAGAKFQVQIDGTTLGTFVTNSTGRIVIGYEQYGAFLDGSASSWTVTVTEVTPPDGFFEPEVKTQTNELRKGQALSPFVYKNQPFPDVTVLKTDAKTAVPLEGAVFSLTGVDNANSFVAVSQADGIARFEKVPVGTYELRETVAPEGYLLSDDVKTVVVREDGAQELSFEFKNLEKPTIIIKKYDELTAKPLPDTEFSVTKKGGEIVWEGLTGADGTITLPHLDDGWYTVTELAPAPGYLPSNGPKDVLLEGGKITEVKFDNIRKPVLVFLKSNGLTGKGIAGATFRVEYEQPGGGLQNLGSFKSGADGRIVIPQVNPGWYVFTETMPANGFSLPSNPVTRLYVEAGQNAYLPEFEHYYTGGSAGTTAPPTVNLTNTTVEEHSGNEYYVQGEGFNFPLNSVVIKKTHAITGELLAGAAFELYRADEQISGVPGTNIGRYTTDNSGIVVITGLEPGYYIVKEVQAPTNFLISENSQQNGYLKPDGTTVLEFTFANYPYGSLLITKTDTQTGLPLAGAKFKVTDDSGAVVGNSNGEFTTDSKGEILIQNLKPGAYVITETVAPNGYALTATPKTIQIGTDGKTYKVAFENSPHGSLVIRKLDSQTKQPLKGAEFKVTLTDGSVVGTSNGIFVTDENGLITIPNLAKGSYIVAETKAPSGYLLESKTQTISVDYGKTYTIDVYNSKLSGMQIIKLDEDTRLPIAGVQFTVAKMNGERVGGIYITDAAGLIRLPELDDGWYTAVEVKAANGYLLDSTPHNFEVKDGKTATLTITNKKAASILLHKVDSITGKGIYGVQFLLSDAGNNPVGTYTSDQDGYVYIGFDEQLPYGKYFLRELRQADGYLRDDEVKTVYLEAGKTSQITWKNTAITGQIQVVKYSHDDNPVTGKPAGTLLKGAVFEIAQARSGAIVGYITTDARGVAASPPLPLGRYTVKEVTAAPYTQLNPERFEAELEYAGQIIRLAVYNKSATLGTEIRKTGNIQVIAGDSMRYDLSVKNTSNVPLSDFYWSDRIPTDAARVTTLTTGTYNSRLYYRVVYKTSSGEWRTLASNLLTTNNYSFSLHANTLGLANGEVVTDVKLEFATVPSGFASVVKPTITVQTLPTLAKGYIITNRAYVGGKYLDAPQESTTAWVTEVIRFDKPTPNPTLPKTGY